jgi:hypothetical protein
MIGELCSLPSDVTHVSILYSLQIHVDDNGSHLGSLYVAAEALQLWVLQEYGLSLNLLQSSRDIWTFEIIALCEPSVDPVVVKVQLVNTSSPYFQTPPDFDGNNLTLRVVSDEQGDAQTVALGLRKPDYRGVGTVSSVRDNLVSCNAFMLFSTPPPLPLHVYDMCTLLGRLISGFGKTRGVA